MASRDFVRFSTSTWAYEGSQALVYHKAYLKGRFKKDCLAEYTQYEYNGQPLFRTAGLDATFYRPATDNQLPQYAKQLPPGFEMCSNVWEELTIPQYPALERYGEKAGAEGGIESKGVAQVVDGLGNPLVIPVASFSGASASLCLSLLLIWPFRWSA